MLGLAGTLLFHGLLVVLFLTLVFTTPIPPWPEEGGGGGGRITQLAVPEALEHGSYDEDIDDDW